MKFCRRRSMAIVAGFMPYFVGYDIRCIKCLTQLQNLEMDHTYSCRIFDLACNVYKIMCFDNIIFANAVLSRIQLILSRIV